MIGTKNILLGALSGALAASAVLIVANAVTPSTAQSPAVHPLVRAQLDTSATADGQDVQVSSSAVKTIRLKDQSVFPAMAQASSAAPSSAAPSAPNAKTVLSSTTRECLRIADAEIDIGNESAFRTYQQQWLAACEQALAADGDNPRVQVALARAYSSIGGKDREAVDLFRAAARRNDAQAWYEIYERFKSFDRGRTNRPQLVRRAEAEQALRQAAELGHPSATMTLAVRLDRGDTVKRDPEEAIHWAELALTRPPKDEERGSMQVLLGRLLVKSANPEQRARGLKLLEALAAQRGDAKAELAEVIRKDDAARARKLFEEALRTYPGHAVPSLADMLIKGEGGPKDEKRAVSLVTGSRASDVPSVRAAHGKLLVEGRLLARDVTKGMALIASGTWEYEARLELMALLGANPDVKLPYPDGLAVDAKEAAELGEPGAMAALIDLKLSGHAQFGDKGGGCELATKSGAPDLIAKTAKLCEAKSL